MWSIAVPGLLMAILGVGWFWHSAQNAVRETARRDAMALAEIIEASFVQGKSQGPAVHEGLDELMQLRAALLSPVQHLRVVAPDGRIRWSREEKERNTLHPERARFAGLREPSVAFSAQGTEVLRPLGNDARCASCHEGAEHRTLGVLQLSVGEPALQRQVSEVFRFALGVVWIFGAAVALATGLSLHFFLTRPLSRLAATMRRAESGNFLVRAESQGEDEFARLGQAFNEVLIRLTAMKAEEIETHRDLAEAKEKLLLRETLEKRLSELSLLFDVARSLSSTLDLPEVLSRISQLIAERLNIPEFSIMLMREDGGLEIQSAYPKDRSLVGLTFGPGEGACGRAAQEKKSIYLPDVTAPQSGFFRLGPVRGMERGALLAVPIVHKGSVLGVLNFQRPQIASFSTEELELCAAVADQAALAVKNAQLYEETVALSITDPLTGVPNRRHLFAQLEMELARAHRFGTQLSVVMLDIDHFKKLNDTSGHRAGDETLRQVSQLLKGAVRKVDTLARYGGEEFMIILPQVSRSEAMDISEKLRRSVVEMPSPYAAAQPGGLLTVSIGVANFPSDAEAQEQLVDHADSALYASKRGGRNRVTAYAPGMELHPGRERGPYVQQRQDPPVQREG